jgi:hypothetical protein
MSLPIIPGPNNELMTQSLAIPPQYKTYSDLAETASYAATASYVNHLWGSWYSTDIQTASLINTGYPVTVNTLIGADGFYISGSNGSTVSGSVIVIPKTSKYDFQFSLQLHNTGGGGATAAANIWLKVNGSNIPWSNTQVSVIANSPYVVAAWDFMGLYNQGDKIELYWSTNHTNIRIESAGASAPAPEIPSSIFTIMEL